MTLLSSYRLGERPYDTLLLQGGKQESKPKNDGSLGNISVRRKQALASLRNTFKAFKIALCLNNNKTYCVECAYDPWTAFCFIECSNVIRNKIAKENKMGETLNGLRLCYHRNEGCKNSLSPSKEYSIILEGNT